MITQQEKEELMRLCHKMDRSQLWSCGMMLLNSSNLRTEQQTNELLSLVPIELKLRLNKEKNDKLRLKK